MMLPLSKCMQLKLRIQTFTSYMSKLLYEINKQNKQKKRNVCSSMLNRAGWYITELEGNSAKKKQDDDESRQTRC